jgi:hypothetical protein
MALNPFFLQGTANEQFLLQDLINEQLKIYGVDVYYLPRKILGTEKLSREVTMSKLDDNFIIEAYLNNYEGYNPQSDIMSKFGIQLQNEISLVISQERFELMIEPFLQDYKLGELHKGEVIVSTRPREGDVIYFPLGQRLFEIKNVEHEKPFFQLGKNYVFELSCELLRLEDEIIDTGIGEIDEAIEDEGYITKLKLVTGAINATATALIAPQNGAVRKIGLTNDGYDYTSAPTVAISTSPVGVVAANATAVAITSDRSIYNVYVTNAGYGYTEAPTVTFSGGGGSGAAATAILGDGSIQYISVATTGAQYVTAPVITITGPSTTAAGSSASAVSTLGIGGSVSEIRLENAGFGYTSIPTVGIASAPTAGIGTFQAGETITGSLSGVTARVKKYDESDNTLEVYINSGTFTPGEVITGAASSASHTLETYDEDPGLQIPFSQNEDIEEFADDIIDFSEGNPFGTY